MVTVSEEEKKKRRRDENIRRAMRRNIFIMQSIIGHGGGEAEPVITNLLTNGDFASNITGWSNIGGSGSSWSAGELQLVGDTVTVQTLSLDAGVQYRFTGTITSFVAGGNAVQILAGPSSGVYWADLDTAKYATGDFDHTFTATGGANSVVGMRAQAGVTAKFDNLSLVRV